MPHVRCHSEAGRRSWGRCRDFHHLLTSAQSRVLCSHLSHTCDGSSREGPQNTQRDKDMADSSGNSGETSGRPPPLVVSKTHGSVVPVPVAREVRFAEDDEVSFDESPKARGNSAGDTEFGHESGTIASTSGNADVQLGRKPVVAPPAIRHSASSDSLRPKVNRGSSGLSREAVVVDLSEPGRQSPYSTINLTPPLAPMSLPEAPLVVPSTVTGFYAAAALQMLEEKSRVEASLKDLVGHLHRLLGEARSKLPADATGPVEAWLQQQFPSQTSAHGMSGWLRKSGKKSITVKKRWVVLDGTSLMYYKDRSETTLKGVLNLYGSRCYGVKRKMELRKKRMFEFEIEAATGKKDTPTAASTTSSSPSMSTPRSRLTSLFSFGKSTDKSSAPAEVPESPFNPMKESKSVYKWFAPSAEERDKWILAITRAAGMPQLERDAMAWANRFSRSSCLAEYKVTLAEFLTTVPYLIMSGDWARVQWTSQNEDKANGASRRDAAMRRDTVSRLMAHSTAEVSAQRRRLGHTLGDRVTWRQLEADVGRDRLRIDGTEMAASDVKTLIAVLADKLLDRLKVVSPGKAGSARAGTPNRSSHKKSGSVDSIPEDLSSIGDGNSGCRPHRVSSLDSLSSDLPDALASTPRDGAASCVSDDGDESVVGLFSHADGQEAHVLEFARDVLLCSSRTVSGGDAFFACELVFRNSGLVFLVPISHEATPVELSIEWLSPREIAEASLSPKARPQPVTGESGKPFPESLSVDTGLPLHVNPLALSSSSPDAVTPTKSLFRTTSSITPKGGHSDVSSAAGDGGVEAILCVRITTTMDYSVRVLGGDDDEDGGSSGDGGSDVVAVVTALYTRTLPFGHTAGPAMVRLSARSPR